MASVWFLAALLCLCGCVLPLQFEEEHDAGPDENHPPAIDLHAPLAPSFPSSLDEVTVMRLPTGQLSPESFEVHVEDKDLDDVLYLRAFRNWHTSKDRTLFDLTIPPTGQIARTRNNVPTSEFCKDITPGTQVLIDIEVADRKFLEDGPDVTPQYRALPVGAKTARGTWVIRCQ